ncbi:MAG: cupin domain-containing protein [Gammaproteobacteria bacterium]|jgi:mannose-6-phosphate isomerase-like protein (cupin superfamily)|nr:cupin domain-containing protein [Gammaproteobacteria bacterium]
MTERMTPGKALAAVKDSNDGLYGVLLEHGSLELGYYKPLEHDDQEPHEQDEIYVVHTGEGEFLLGEERIAFAPGDALFVPAGVEHRFVDFTEDFGAWVIFYGPEGGEAAE